RGKELLVRYAKGADCTRADHARSRRVFQDLRLVASRLAHPIRIRDSKASVAGPALADQASLRKLDRALPGTFAPCAVGHMVGDLFHRRDDLQETCLATDP